MKTKIITIIGLVAITSSTIAQQLSVSEIIRKIDKNEKVLSSESTARQTIVTSNGNKRTLEMTSYSKDNNDKQLSVYTSPSRVAGDKILMLNDGNDIWFYTPKTDRVRHLASHAKKQKVQGSDFAYEDMSGGNYEEDYTNKLMGTEKIDNRTCYKLEMIPTENGPHYSKIILWADVERFVILRVDYYEEGELLKRLTCTNIENISGHWMAKYMKMKNLQDSGETIIETLSMKVDVTLDDKVFSTNNLTKN
jgi:outer membrane lipoprotein-sorting protein